MVAELDLSMDTKQNAACNGAAEEEEPELFKADDFRIYCMKVLPCSKRSCHDWQQCPYAHPGEKAKRRDPSLHNYTGIACPNMKQARKCPRGDACPYAHNVFEYWLHPSRYRTQMCKDGAGCTRRICFFAHAPQELRTNAKKPHVSPEALASATAAAALEATHTAAPAPNGEADQVNLLSALLKAHSGGDRDALKHLQAQAMGGQPAQGQQQRQLVDALATLLLSNGYLQHELPEAQSQPLPAIDDRLDLAAMGKFNSVPMFGQARRRSIGRPARHSIDLASSLAAVAAPVAADNMLDSYDFFAGGAADPPPRYSQREEAAYKAGIAAAMAAQNQQEQQQAQAAEFMQSLQQAARAQAAAADAESAAAAQLHPCAGFLGKTGAFGSSPFDASPIGAAGSFAPQQPAMCAIMDTGTWTYEAEGMDFTTGGNAFGINMGRLSTDSTRCSSDMFTLLDSRRCSRSEGLTPAFRCSEDSVRSSMDCGTPAANWSNFGSETAAPSQTPFVNYRLSSLFATTSPFDASASRGF